MFCGKCGHEVDDDARWCGNCGAPINEVQSDVIISYKYDDSSNMVDKIQHAPLVSVILTTYLLLGICAFVCAVMGFLQIGFHFYLPYPFNTVVYYIQVVSYALIGNYNPNIDRMSNIAGLISSGVMSLLVMMFFLNFKKYPNNCKSLFFQSVVIFALSLIYCIATIYANFKYMTNGYLNFYYITTFVGPILTSIVRLYLLIYFYDKAKEVQCNEALNAAATKTIFVCSVFLIIVAILDFIPVISYLIIDINIFAAPLNVWASIPLSILCFGAGFSGINAAKKKDWSAAAFTFSMVILIAFVSLSPCVFIAFGTVSSAAGSIGGIGIALNALLVFYIVIFIFMVITPLILAVQSYKKLQEECK